MDLNNIEKVRAEIPALKNSIYMNTGGTGPLPKTVLGEVNDTFQKIGEGGPDVKAIRDPIKSKLEDTRDIIAHLLNASSDEITFTRSISEGLSIVAYGLDWEADDEVIVTGEEHPSSILIWLSLAKRYGIKVRKLQLQKSKEAYLRSLENLINDKTKLISLSHVTTDTGTRLPAKEICQFARSRNVIVGFDGAQSIGQFEVNLKDMGCDFYAGTGHKWVLGGWGVGMLYIKKELFETVKVSWTGNPAASWDKNTDEIQFQNSARRYEFGGRHVPLYNAMGKGIEFVTSLGISVIESRVTDLKQQLINNIIEIPSVKIKSPISNDISTGMVTFSIDGISGSDLNKALWNRFEIMGREALSDTSMRICIAFFNSESEISAITSAIETIAQETR